MISKIFHLINFNINYILKEIKEYIIGQFGFNYGIAGQSKDKREKLENLQLSTQRCSQTYSSLSHQFSISRSYNKLHEFKKSAAATKLNHIKLLTHG